MGKNKGYHHVEESHAQEYFDIVLSKICEPKESCVVIGDSLSSDMLGAKNAGLRSVWFMPVGDVEQACVEYDIDFTAKDFEELLSVLKNFSKSK